MDCKKMDCKKKGQENWVGKVALSTTCSGTTSCTPAKM